MDPRERLVMTVALSDEVPRSQGRTWTADDYATRDTQLAALGVRSLRQRQRCVCD